MHAVALGVGLAGEVHLEVDGAHDAVAELLVDQLLEGRAVNVDELVEAVDQRIGRHGGGQCAFVRHHLQQLHGRGVEVEQRANHSGLFGTEGHLAQASGGHPLLALAHGLGHVRPVQAFGNLGSDDGLGHVVAIHGSSLLLGRRWKSAQVCK